MVDVVKTVSGFPSAGRYTADGDPAVISVKTWSGDEPPKGILQLNHGMQEYIDRYDEFARIAVTHRWRVVGMDFIGHGDSVETDDQLAFTGVKLAGGRNPFLEDVHTLRVQTQRDWPGLPYFMLGHSMGSFVLRAYLREHGQGLQGAIISGTSAMGKPLIWFGKSLLGTLDLFYPPTHRSTLFESMSVGAYETAFRRPGEKATGFEWLSRDPVEVGKYIEDYRCGMVFTMAANHLLMDVVSKANAGSTYASTHKDLPILIVSGKSDPVGAMAVGVRKVADSYRRAGITDLTVNLYPEARHELFHETNRIEVYTDILTWMDERIPEHQ